MIVALLLFMLLAHILDDYVLQAPWLSRGKQKAWWEKNASDSLYKNDYIMALVCHALSWSIMIMLPLIIYSLGTGIDLRLFYLAVPVNLTIHAIVDDLKANRHKINLIVDQSIHFGQIIVTWLIFVLVFGVR